MKDKFFMQGPMKLSNIQPLILVWITRYNFASTLSSEKVNTDCHFILLLISPFYESPHFSVVCGDGSCDTDQSEDCSTCPKDCGKCPLQTHEIALIAVFSCLVVIAGIVVFIVSKIDSGKKNCKVYMIKCLNIHDVQQNYITCHLPKLFPYGWADLDQTLRMWTEATKIDFIRSRASATPLAEQTYFKPVIHKSSYLMNNQSSIPIFKMCLWTRV